MIGRGSTAQQRQAAIDLYDQYYTEPGQLRDSDAFYRWVLKKLAPTPGCSLLDVACGEGHLLRFAAARGLIAWGVDLSSRAVALARRIVGQDIIAIADGESLPFPSRSFDYVTCLGSLEHFVSPEQGLVEMRRVLKPYGLAALLLPNSYYLFDIIWHVWRQGYPVSHRQKIERFATVGEWRDFIQAHGFRVICTYKYNLCLPRSLEDLRWYARSPKKIISALLSPLTPFNLSYSFLFICKRYGPT
ncbi:MAG: class I SAM-dependent methyltransferase [Candidatus Methanomethyliaceae archaeon]